MTVAVFKYGKIVHLEGAEIQQIQKRLEEADPSVLGGAEKECK